MTVSEQRWLLAWHLLSLDRLLPFYPDVWLRVEDPPSFQDALRSILEPWLEYDINAKTVGRVHHEAATWFTTQFGRDALGDLRSWTAHILQFEGPDRVAEFDWRLLIVRLAKFEPSTPEWLKARFQDLSVTIERRDQAIETRLEADFHKPLSPWDGRIASMHRQRPSGLDLIISQTCGANHLVIVWEEKCGDLTANQLQEIFQVGRKVAAERASARESETVSDHRRVRAPPGLRGGKLDSPCS